MDRNEFQLRESIVASCREMNALGINQGAAGNISVRHGGGMLISPSATPYDRMTPDMVAWMPFGSDPGAWHGPRRPSTEWRFHSDILRNRPEVNAVVHAHPVHATALAMARRPIPAAHYMVAAFGGAEVRCAGYARFGTPELSDLALSSLDGRMACLLANHGVIVLGETLDKAMWRAVELETLARQYCVSLSIGGPVLLSAAEIDETLAAFADYGHRTAGDAED